MWTSWVICRWMLNRGRMTCEWAGVLITRLITTQRCPLKVQKGLEGQYHLDISLYFHKVLYNDISFHNYESATISSIQYWASTVKLSNCHNEPVYCKFIGTLSWYLLYTDRLGKVQHLRPGGRRFVLFGVQNKTCPPAGGAKKSRPLPEAKEFTCPLHDFTIEK